MSVTMDREMDTKTTKDRSSASGEGLGGASVSGSKYENEKSINGNQFDVVNWLYWNLWWQQYSFWNSVHHQSFNQHWNGAPGTGTGQQPPSMAPPPLNMNIGMNPFVRPQITPGIRTRVISGYESCIAPLWRRGVAELIDTLLVGLLLRFYLPDVDYRVPELIFEGPDMWDDMTLEDLTDARDTLLLFLYSTLLHRAIHISLEALLLCVVKCTPGKWLMGLRVWRCATPPSLTRTFPGYSIKVEPAGNISFPLCMGRSLFKSTVSLVIPLVIFFFQLDKGRTQYDRLFRCVVVDTYSLNKPLYTTVVTRNNDR